jgi:hypothetical protein
MILTGKTAFIVCCTQILILLPKQSVYYDLLKDIYWWNLQKAFIIVLWIFQNVEMVEITGNAGEHTAKW